MKPALRAAMLVALWLLNGAGAHSQSNDLPVDPFQTHFEVYAAGFSAGEAVMTLVATGPGAYQMRSEVRPNALAALLVSGQIDEKARGEIRDGAIHPLQYQRRVETAKKNQAVELDFDWTARQIQARNGQKQAILPLSSGVMDPLSLNLQVMWDLQRGRLPAEYQLADETELKSYQIRNEGEETLETSLGKRHTIRISQAKPGKSRVTTFWFAPDLRYLPVRVQQTKDGKELLRMEIRAINR